MDKKIITAPIWAAERLRMGMDGKGVTTLVCFYGCPLSCKYCINKKSTNPETEVVEVTPKELFDEVKKDHLYYIYTEGGITFGGGEPLLQAAFIEAFAKLAPKEWKLRIETSLQVQSESLMPLLPIIDEWIVDVKEMDPDNYLAYTGKSQEIVLTNLKILKRLPDFSEKVRLRVPKIPGMKQNMEGNILQLKAMGFTKIEVFDYVIPN